MRPAAVPYRPVFIERTARIRTPHTMGPKPATRSTSGDAGGDAALRLVEVLNDEALMKKLRTALFPQALSDKFDRQNDQINRLLAQLTVRQPAGRRAGEEGEGARGAGGQDRAIHTSVKPALLWLAGNWGRRRHRGKDSGCHQRQDGDAPPSDFIGHRAVAPARTAKSLEAHPLCDRPLHQRLGA